MIRIERIAVVLILMLSIKTASAQDVPEVGYFNLTAGGGKVYLAWQLQAGSTCFGITVHRSADGMNFESIGGIEGVCGDLNTPQSYSYIDEDPPLNQRVYYRLEMGSGNFTESRFVDVIDLQGTTFQVRPNPVTSVSTIFFVNPGKDMHTLTISDLQGRIIYSQETRNDHLTIHASYFARGLYIFSIRSSVEARAMTGKILLMPR